MLVPVFHVEILMEESIKHFMSACFHFVIYCPQTPFSQNQHRKERGREGRATVAFIDVEKREWNWSKLNTMYREILLHSEVPGQQEFLHTWKGWLRSLEEKNPQLLCKDTQERLRTSRPRPSPPFTHHCAFLSGPAKSGLAQ